MDPMAFARFDDVSITFFKDKGDRPFTAVENFDLTIEEGEFFCLLGPSAASSTSRDKRSRPSFSIVSCDNSGLRAIGYF